MFLKVSSVSQTASPVYRMVAPDSLTVSTVSANSLTVSLSHCLPDDNVDLVPPGDRRQSLRDSLADILLTVILTLCPEVSISVSPTVFPFLLRADCLWRAVGAHRALVILKDRDGPPQSKHSRRSGAE